MFLWECVSIQSKQHLFSHWFWACSFHPKHPSKSCCGRYSKIQGWQPMIVLHLKTLSSSVLCKVRVLDFTHLLAISMISMAEIPIHSGTSNLCVGVLRTVPRCPGLWVSCCREKSLYRLTVWLKTLTPPFQPAPPTMRRWGVFIVIWSLPSSLLQPHPHLPAWCTHLKGWRSAPAAGCGTSQQWRVGVWHTVRITARSLTLNTLPTRSWRCEQFVLALFFTTHSQFCFFCTF